MCLLCGTNWIWLMTGSDGFGQSETHLCLGNSCIISTYLKNVGRVAQSV